MLILKVNTEYTVSTSVTVAYLSGKPVHDRTDRHLAVSLDLRHEGLTEVEVPGVLQPHRATSGLVSDLPVTALLVAEWSTLIGPGPSRSCALIGGTLNTMPSKVYAITTHLKASI